MMEAQGKEIKEFSESLFSEYDNKTQNNGALKPNKIKDIKHHPFQKGSKIWDQNKSQQNQAYLTSLLFKNLNIDNISVEIKPHNEEYADIMGVLQARTQGNSDYSRQQILNRKQNIVNKQMKDTKQMMDFKEQYLEKKKQLHEKSYELFQKLINVLEQKINEISNTKFEEGIIKKEDEIFHGDVQKKDFNSYDQVHNIFKKINNLYSQDKQIIAPQMMQQRSYRQEAYGQDHKMNQEYSQMKGNQDMEIENDYNYMQENDNKNLTENRMEQEDQKNQFPLSYNKQQIDTFFKEVQTEDVINVYKIFEDIQSKFKNLEKKYQNDVTNPLSKRKSAIQQLFDEVKQRMNNFILSLPFNYFALKQKEVFDYYQLPSYSENQVNEQQYEQMMKDNRKSIIAYSIKFSIGDLRRLTKDQLINDNLLDCYAQHLIETHRHLKKQSLYQNPDQDKSEIMIFSHLFFETQYESMRIKQGEAVTFIENILQNPIKNLFDLNCFNRFGFIVNVELHQIKHWIFLSVLNQSREIVYHDSASGNNSYYKNLTTALIAFFSQASGHTYTARKLDKCPRQQNGTDCGMFVLKYMQNFAFNSPQEFDQDHITQLRQKLYTFFPLLSYQQYHKKIDYEVLQYFEGRILSRYDAFKPELSRNLLTI